MYKVEYYGDPCKPQGFNHIGLSSVLIQKDFMEFIDEISAYEFLIECTEPITEAKDIFPGGKVPAGVLKKKLQFQEMDNLEDIDSQEL